ncbi:MAG: hypothetical protein U1F41_06565 [Burkholderiales bacterium]
MTKRTRLWLIAVLALPFVGLVVLWESIVWNWYSAEPLQAIVIDATTRKPLPGVAVVAAWELLGGDFHGTKVVGYVKVLEATTDESGRFSFPAWGPRPGRGVIRDGAPLLILFKPGYDYDIRANNGPTGQNAESPLRSRWNGRTIELKPFQGTAEEYAGRMGRLGGEMWDIEQTKSIREIAAFLCVANRQSEDLAHRGVKGVFPASIWLRSKGIECNP